MSRTTAFSTKMRQRRNTREFNRALQNASPSMQQELLAAAARHSGLSR